MRLTRIAGVFVVAALALGLAACGDEEADEQTRDEVVEAANAICDKFEKRVEEIDEPRSLRNTEQASLYFGELAGVFEAAEIEFRAVDPGEDTEDDWNAFVRKQREGRDLTTRIANKTIKGDRSYINDLGEIERIDRESDEIARQVGATGCTSS